MSDRLAELNERRKHMGADPVRKRSIEQLHGVVSMLANYIWTKQLRPGEHMWSIPVDQERDFDCILTDAIEELESLRSASPAQASALHQPREESR